MQYIIVFLEGIVTFISPCILPMLPIYLSYLAGNLEENHSSGGGRQAGLLINAIGFVMGFSVLFILLGAAAGTFGSFIIGHTGLVNILAGMVMVLFGLNFLGVIQIGFLNRTKSMDYKGDAIGFLPAVLFGFIFGISWSPCVGAFLGSALALAASSGTAAKGIAMLAVYSAGLGIPFVLSALLLRQMTGAFDFIKRNYRRIMIASGLMLILMGIFTALGLFNVIAGLLS